MVCGNAASRLALRPPGKPKELGCVKLQLGLESRQARIGVRGLHSPFHDSTPVELSARS
jgi:hypothetical protein